jgi:hypothetical protein
MAAFLPVLVAGAHLSFGSEQMPQLDISPSCRAAANATQSQRGCCERAERAARDKLQQDWDQYSDGQQGHCVRPSSLGGFAKLRRVALAVSNWTKPQKASRRKAGREASCGEETEARRLYFLPAEPTDCAALYADICFGLSLSAFGFFFSFGTRI